MGGAGGLLSFASCLLPLASCCDASPVLISPPLVLVWGRGGHDSTAFTCDRFDPLIVVANLVLLCV